MPKQKGGLSPTLFSVSGTSYFVIGTGESHSLRDFLAATFGRLGLDWQAHVDINHSIFRATDLAYSGANVTKARSVLGWSAATHFQELVARLVDEELAGA